MKMAGRVDPKRVSSGKREGGQFAEDTSGATNIPKSQTIPTSPVQSTRIADVPEGEKYIVEYLGKVGYWSENLALVGNHWTNCYPGKVGHRWGFGERTCIQVGESGEHRFTELSLDSAVSEEEKLKLKALLLKQRQNANEARKKMIDDDERDKNYRRNNSNTYNGKKGEWRTRNIQLLDWRKCQGVWHDGKCEAYGENNDHRFFEIAVEKVNNLYPAPTAVKENSALPAVATQSLSDTEWKKSHAYQYEEIGYIGVTIADIDEDIELFNEDPRKYLIETLQRAEIYFAREVQVKLLKELMSNPEVLEILSTLHATPTEIEGDPYLKETNSMSSGCLTRDTGIQSDCDCEVATLLEVITNFKKG
jgi:hypothetical protein